MKFEVNSNYAPAGDQIKTIKELSDSILANNKYQTLLGVTGSGKTFTMANIIQKVQRPTLIMTHNKTLAAQLYSEFKNFFPKNKVEYFISNFDYYQPEAYIPRQDLFIDKDSSINDELERLRLAATTSLLSHDDVIVVASVSANYGLGSAEEFAKTVLTLNIGDKQSQKKFIMTIVDMGYTRNDAYFDRGNFRVNGDVIDIYPAYSEDMAIRIEFFDDEIEAMMTFDYIENKKVESLEEYTLYAANQFIVSQERLKIAINSIEKELDERLAYLKSEDKDLECNRLKNRTEFDLEMIKENGVCKGIENYSRHLTGRKAGETPSSLHDYFTYKKKPYLIIVDESHVSLPQFGGMYAGDRSRKTVLVDYGFRLPSALDNRPLKYDEFIEKADNYLFVSATPNERELSLSATISEQVIRPTGLLDPPIEIKDSQNQVETLHDEMKATIDKGFRILVTTLTKKMAEDLTTYYNDLGIKTKYMHSDIGAIERNEIIRGLRAGDFDLLVGINLLREGLDLPEVALVAIMDADKEGFLRSETSLIQTIGRAARNSESKVILFAKKMTKSMQSAIDITNHRREIQEAYNKKHGITPKTVIRKIEDKLEVDKSLRDKNMKYDKKDKLPKTEKQKLLKEMTKTMHESAKMLEFEEAARLRDEIAKIRRDL